MGEALRRDADDGGGRRAAAARVVALRRAGAAPLVLVLAALAGCREGNPPARSAAPPSDVAVIAGGPTSFGGAARLDSGRFTVVAYPRDMPLARSLLRAALTQDSFPGLPRPAARVVLAVAPDRATFREWVGPGAPEWGGAIAFPASSRIVMQGSGAGSDAGEPLGVLRHELAHLALHEALGDLPPRWFDEGYASYSARELEREQVLATNVALALRGMPSLEQLDSAFLHGSGEAQAAYALAYTAVGELAALDPQRGLALFFRYWRESGSFEIAVRSAYGITASAYEKRWQGRTRSRYGALALVADLTLGMLLLSVVVLPLYVSRRRRDRRRMQALREADAAAERRQREESALDELLAEPATLPATADPPPASPGDRVE